jgi:hypothetical protein
VTVGRDEPPDAIDLLDAEAAGRSRLDAGPAAPAVEPQAAPVLLPVVEGVAVAVEEIGLVQRLAYAALDGAVEAARRFLGIVDGASRERVRERDADVRALLSQAPLDLPSGRRAEVRDAGAGRGCGAGGRWGPEAIRARLETRPVGNAAVSQTGPLAAVEVLELGAPAVLDRFEDERLAARGLRVRRLGGEGRAEHVPQQGELRLDGGDVHVGDVGGAEVRGRGRAVARGILRGLRPGRSDAAAGVGGQTILDGALETVAAAVLEAHPSLLALGPEHPLEALVEGEQAALLVGRLDLYRPSHQDPAESAPHHPFPSRSPVYHAESPHPAAGPRMGSTSRP